MDLKDKLSRLTNNQLEVLNFVLHSKTVSSTATGSRFGMSGSNLGGTLSSLKRNGLIQPWGREEDSRNLNWKVTEKVENQKDEAQRVIDALLGRGEPKE